MGWARCCDGKLPRRAANHGFDALGTVDQGFEQQRNVSERPIPVVSMIAVRTRLQELRPRVAGVIAVLSVDPECRIHPVAA